jgi:hypothetical protein
MKTVFSELNSLNGRTKPKEKISYEDFLAWCDEDTWAEWVDGDAIMVSPASKQHQREAVEGFWLQASWLWQEPLPPVWEIWRELDLLR